MAVHCKVTTGHRTPWNLHWYYHTHHYCCDCPNFQLFQTAHHLQIYQWHYWSFYKDFTIVSHFTDHASSEILQHHEGVPVKLVMPCATTRLLASKWPLLQTEKLLFLWSVTHFFTSASRSGHFAACVQNGVYSSLISVFLPLVMSTHV